MRRENLPVLFDIKRKQMLTWEKGHDAIGYNDEKNEHLPRA